MIFVSKTPSCPQDSNPPCTPWFFILILAHMVSGAADFLRIIAVHFFY